MAVHCGFFNSVNGDKKYEAELMSRPYELLISNGVFATPAGTPSNYLQVYSSEGMRITVKAGRGMFFDKWFINDSDMPLIVEPSDVILNRIDSVIARVDKSEALRAGTIYIKKGTPASSPVAPELTRSGTVMEYRLANIRVNANVNTITQAMISDRRGYTDECGWVTSLVQQVDTTTLWEQWQAAFEDWFYNVKETLATSTLIRSYTSTYVTTKQDETLIPINIGQYNHDLDIMQVYINGLLLVPELEYVGNNNNTDITLTNGVDVGTPISFIVYKSIDGSNAESIVGQVETLQNLMPTALNGMTKYVMLSGNVLENFRAYGAGMHTFYAGYAVQGFPQGSSEYRCFGHLTDENTGWLIAVQFDGSMYYNTLNTSWSGWKTIYEQDPWALWSDTAFPNDGETITPSKPLSQCAHGWTLVWCGYNEDDAEPTDMFVQTYNIPKRSYKNADWNGENLVVPLIINSAPEWIYKDLLVYDDRIVSAGYNASGDSRGMVLCSIHEY